MEYGSEEELLCCLELCHTRYSALPIFHIGSGSNLLFLSDYDGVMLSSRIKDIEVLKDDGQNVLLRVGSGVMHDDLVSYCVSNGLYGMENLSLIPGQVGASAVQNIGAYGVEACDVIERVEGVSLSTGERCHWTCRDCRYGYRSSIFKHQLQGQYAITYVTYHLSRTFTPRLDYGGLRDAISRKGLAEETLTAGQLRDVIIETRRSKLPDPEVTGNAGSFFMNPVVKTATFEELSRRFPGIPSYAVDSRYVKIPAGWLIEQSGWKGRSLGPAAVHDRQALVLVNKGGATGRDIIRLSEAIRRDVREKFGIELKPEVIAVGKLSPED